MRGAACFVAANARPGDQLPIAKSELQKRGAHTIAAGAVANESWPVSSRVSSSAQRQGEKFEIIRSSLASLFGIASGSTAKDSTKVAAFMEQAESIVFAVDDDRRVRDALSELFLSIGLRCVAFESAESYLDFERPDVSACLILDVRMPGVGGLELQSQIAGAAHPPIIFISGHGDIPSCVRALKAGAIDFLTKPFSECALIDAVQRAIAQDAKDRATRAELLALRQRFELLTTREREVLPLVVSGLLNKQAAAELGISGVTLQIHRGKVMSKMAAESLADLVRMAALLNVPLTRKRSSVEPPIP